MSLAPRPEAMPQKTAKSQPLKTFCNVFYSCIPLLTVLISKWNAVQLFIVRFGSGRGGLGCGSIGAGDSAIREQLQLKV